MNYDATFYYTLTPLVLGLAWYAGAVLSASVLFHWIRGAWSGVQGHQERAFSAWKSAGLALLLFILFYAPIPNLGEIIGFRDDDVQIEKTDYGRATIAVFLLERVSYGVDDLLRRVLSWDVTVAALEGQRETSVSGEAATVRTARPPNSSDIVYAFVVLRAQFITRYYRQLWRRPSAEPAEGEQEENRMGIFSLIKNLSGPQRTEFLTKQLTEWLYSLSASLGLIFFILVFMIISLILFVIAGLVKYAAMFLMATFLFVFPIAYFFRGTKVLRPALSQILTFLLLKGAALLVIWIGFFMIEGVMLQGLRELAVDDHLVSDFVEKAEPGFIYTDAGSSLLFAAEQGERQARGATASLKTMLSFLIILLAMIYIIIKLPGFISSLFGSSGGEDILSTPVIIAGAVASAGSSLVGQGAQGAANSMTRQ